MITFCPAIHDDHLSGPHRLVTPVTTQITRVKGVKDLVVRVVTGPTLVICTACDHWVARPFVHCTCYCHREVCQDFT